MVYTYSKMKLVTNYGTAQLQGNVYMARSHVLLTNQLLSYIATYKQLLSILNSSMDIIVRALDINN